MLDRHHDNTESRLDRRARDNHKENKDFSGDGKKRKSFPKYL